MVCPRCIMAVRQILDRLQIPFETVELGKAMLSQPLSKEMENQLKTELEAIGFEWIYNKQKQAVDEIRTAIIQLIENEDLLGKYTLSAYLSDRFHKEYSALSKLFSEETGGTIEKYFILQKVERIKEWLSYGILSLSEMADRLNYSSSAHLSTQFKQVVGLTPTQYRQQQANGRKSLDAV